MGFLEKKVAELENDSLLSGDLKSKLKQENTQLVHRYRKNTDPQDLCHRKFAMGYFVMKTHP